VLPEPVPERRARLALVPGPEEFELVFQLVAYLFLYLIALF
jgi:hypothetical protein